MDGSKKSDKNPSAIKITQPINSSDTIVQNILIRSYVPFLTFRSFLINPTLSPVSSNQNLQITALIFQAAFHLGISPANPLQAYSQHFCISKICHTLPRFNLENLPSKLEEEIYLHQKPSSLPYQKILNQIICWLLYPIKLLSSFFDFIIHLPFPLQASCIRID